MSEFINSSETLGSIDAVVDALVAHSPLDLNDDSIVSIGKQALYKNDGLHSVNLPNLTDAGAYAFRDCTAMTSASFAKLKTISGGMFSGCITLTTLSCPELTNISWSAFENCASLVQISIPIGMKNLNSDCFAGCKSLETNSFPGITTVADSVFRDCCRVGVVALPACTSISAVVDGIGKGLGPTGFDFTALSSIKRKAFYNSSNMQHLVLRSSTLCTLANVNAFTGTPIERGFGYIYVPTELVDTYKAASNWSTFASQIQPISAYPKAPPGSISDSWEQIIESELDGTYTSKYSIGDSKAVNIGGAYVLMRIVAMDSDVLASDTSKTAPITWISEGIIEKRAMNSTGITSGGWENTDMREYLRESIFPRIETVVRENIKEVHKTSISKSPSNTVLTSVDTIWIPSYREVFGGTTRESSGPVYSSAFYNGSSRTKKEGVCGAGDAKDWWLRSAKNSSSFEEVRNYGGVSDETADVSYGIVLGFCT